MKSLPMTADRFPFGANWARFLETVDEQRIAAAVASLKTMLGVETLTGQRFLDIGSGSGLFSLAAHRLGAEVQSFDYDPLSVGCTHEIKRRFAPEATTWMIEQGSALDEEYLSRLEPADVVYSWGVLHHTGDMWKAIDLTSHCVKPGGQFWLAIYNDQGRTTQDWISVKRSYQRLPTLLQPVLVAIVGVVLLTHRVLQATGSSLVHLLTLRNPLTPFRSLANRAQSTDARGMHRWYDLTDWVGGWPFDVARPEEIIDFLTQRGFNLQRLQTVGGRMGCNEFVFQKLESVL